MPKPFYYYLGPWRWVEDDPAFGGPYWAPPRPAFGGIDLSPIRPDIQEHGLFVFPEHPADAGGYLYLGAAEPGARADVELSRAARDHWRDRFLLDGLEGKTLREVLWETLTFRAEARGLNRAKPVIPRRNGVLELHLPLHPRIHARMFRGRADPAWPAIRDVLRADYRRIRNHSTGKNAPAGGRDIHRRVLGEWQRKYHVTDHREFIPDDLPDEVPLEPHTSHQDDFNRANESLDASPWWTEVRSEWAVDTYRAYQSAGTTLPPHARYEADLSTDDQYVELDTVAYHSGRAKGTSNARVSATEHKCYACLCENNGGATDKMYQARRDNGWGTELARIEVPSYSLPYTTRTQMDGSTLEGYINGDLQNAVTDTVHTGFLRSGMEARGDGNAVELDNFFASDIRQPPIELGGSIQGTSSLQGEVWPVKLLAGSIAAAGQMAAQVTLPLRGTVRGVSELTGRLTGTWHLRGEIAAQASLAATLDFVAIQIAGAIHGSAALSSPRLWAGRTLRGTLTGTSAFGTAPLVVRRFVAVAGNAAAASTFSYPALIRLWHPSLQMSRPGTGIRQLVWGADVPSYLLVDGRVHGEIDEPVAELDASFGARQFLVAVDEVPATPRTPMDIVRLNWEDTGALRYRISRRPVAGAWEDIGEVEGTEYLDGPLADGDYDYKVAAIDEDGDSADSEAASITVSSAPEPPADLEWSWDGAAGKLTLTWTASPSADVAGYRVRSSAGLATLDLRSAPVQDSPDTTCEQIFTTETGTWLFSVRAVDSDGKEEANLSQVVAVPFENGAPAALPAEPLLVEARAISGSRIELEWLYDPAYEYLGPGAAHEARIYWDAGTGIMDWSAPHTIVAMNNPIEAARYLWQSGVLTDGQEYRFVVRIGTAARPEGHETTNTDTHAATADADLPTAPEMTAQVI